jgi:hypothetical protein
VLPSFVSVKVYVPGASIWIVPGSNENSCAETEIAFPPPGVAAELVPPLSSLLFEPHALSARAANAAMRTGKRRIHFPIRCPGPIGLPA